MSRAELENKIAVLLGGRAAEKLAFSEISTGAADDLAKATDIACSMVTRYGMVEELGYVAYEGKEPRFLEQAAGIAHGGLQVSQDTAKRIDDAVRALIMNTFDRTYKLLEANRPILERAARTLLEKETLDEAELKALAAGLKTARSTAALAA